MSHDKQPLRIWRSKCCFNPLPLIVSSIQWSWSIGWYPFLCGMSEASKNHCVYEDKLDCCTSPFYWYNLWIKVTIQLLISCFSARNYSYLSIIIVWHVPTVWFSGVCYLCWSVSIMIMVTGYHIPSWLQWLSSEHILLVNRSQLLVYALMN